jgi:hypothetical protein
MSKSSVQHRCQKLIGSQVTSWPINTSQLIHVSGITIQFRPTQQTQLHFLSPRSKGSNPEISQEHDEGLNNLQTLTVSQQHNPTQIHARFITKYTIQQQISPENESTAPNFPIKWRIISILRYLQTKTSSLNRVFSLQFEQSSDHKKKTQREEEKKERRISRSCNSNNQVITRRRHREKRRRKNEESPGKLIKSSRLFVINHHRRFDNVNKR